MNAAEQMRADVAPRAPRAKGGHVESYFLRANDPKRPRALWIKATVYKPIAGTPLQESWFAFFDGEKKRSFARKRSEPLAVDFAVDDGNSLRLAVGGAAWKLATQGSTRGEQDGARWDVAFERMAGPIGEPLCFLPTRILLETPLPKSKMLTPMPALNVSGSVQVFDETVDVGGWFGALGHNWGREHTYEYAWGQCYFPATATQPASWAEGGTGRLKIGPVITPRFSPLVVQRGDESFRFDRTFDTWTQKATLGEQSWRVELRSDVGRAVIEMDAAGRPVVCLGYRDPTGTLAYCVNSKLARTRVTVEPKRGAPFTLESEHGGALEFLRHDPVAGLEVV